MSEEAPKLNGDAPLTDPKHDRLGRKPFCEKLARILAKGNASGSTVVAIYGDWGVGKTTAKNFTVNFLKKNHGIEAIEFEPWGWSGRDKVIEALFTKVEVALRGKNLPKTKEWVEKIHRVLGVAVPFIDTATLVWPAAGTLLSFGFVWLSSTYALEREWANAILLGFVAAGTGLTGLVKLTKAIRKYNNELEAARFAALDDVRDDLVKELSEKGKSLVVIIDDVDRLEPAEIRQVVQVVKAVANLPHVVFLLLFQRDVVTRALDDVAGTGKGQEFLEKVIQVGFHMPEPPPGRISEMLEESIAELRKDARFERRWSQERWEKEVKKLVGGYFRNVRDVARFSSSLNVYLDQHFHQDSLEVNPVDLVALEALRMFEPGVFENLSAVPLVGPSQLIELLMPISKEFKAKRDLDLDRLTKLAGDETRPGAGRLLRVLFPQLNEHFSASPEKLTAFDAAQRVCHPLHYTKYFDLNLLQDRATDRDFCNVVGAAKELEQLRKEFGRIEELKIRPDMLTRLGPHIKDLTPIEAENFVIALAEAGERVPSYRDPDSGQAGKEQAEAQIIGILQAQTDSKRRVELCLSMFRKTSALDIPVSILRYLNSLTTRNDPMDRPLTSKEENAELIAVAVERIREDAAQGRLFRRPWFLQHFYFWGGFGSADETKAWAAEFAKDTTSARRLLAAWRQDIISTGDTVRRIPTMDGEGLDRLIGFEFLDRVLAGATATKEDESDEGIALRLYAEAKSRKAAGQKYGQVTLPGSGY